MKPPSTSEFRLIPSVDVSPYVLNSARKQVIEPSKFSILGPWGLERKAHLDKSTYEMVQPPFTLDFPRSQN